MKKPSIRFSVLIPLLFAGISDVMAQARQKDTTSRAHSNVRSIDSLTLFRDSIQLETVNITSKKPLIENKNGKVILNVANSILAAGSSALEILAKAPGLSVNPEGDISFRGKNGLGIMIDGKLSQLSTTEITALLRTINGNTIESIELMSQPGAKYDASGSAGIINIRLRKNSNDGTNGTISGGFGYGSFHKSNGGIGLNHRSGGLNLFGNYDYGNNKDFQDLKITRSNDADGQYTFFNQTGREVTNRENNMYKVGADYSLNDRHTFGIVFNGYSTYTKGWSDNQTAIGNQPFLIDSTVRALNPVRSRYINQSYNLNYKATLDTSGQELTADMDLSRFQQNNSTVYNNYFYTSTGTQLKAPLIFRNATPSKINIWTGKIDYVYPFTAHTKLEAGLKSSNVSSDNYFQFENLPGDEWLNDPSRSNTFNYKEQVNAAYGNFSKEFASTTIQLGLRGELTHSEGSSPDAASVVKRDYFNLFPNISVLQQLSGSQDLGLSYSRRIDRPDYQSLNPFLYFSDLYTYNQGNPLLKPQYTNAFELTYVYRKTLNVTLGYSHTKDVITTTLLTDTIAKTLVIKDDNLARQHTYNLNAAMPITISKWWGSSNNATLYYTRFNSPDFSGSSFHSGKTSYLLNTVHNFTISPLISAELSANYQSAQVYGTYAIKPMYSVDLGISRTFAKQRASIKLAASDLFNTARARVSSAIPSQDYQLYQKAETRIFRLTFSYNFGSSLIKAARAHTTGAETELKRVKSGN